MRAFAWLLLFAPTVACGCAATGTPPPRLPDPGDVAALEARAVRDTSRIEPQLRLAEAYRAQGRAGDALSVSEKALARWPANARAALLVAVAREDLADYPGAREAYARAARLATTARLRSELSQRQVLLQRRESQALVKAALAREAELARTPPRPRTVAVFPLAVVAPDSLLVPLGRALTAMLITDLARTDRLTVLDRTMVQILAGEIQLAELGYVDEPTAVRGGRLLGAERIVQGSLAAAEEQLRLEAAVVSLAREGAPAESAAAKAAPAAGARPQAPAKPPAPAKKRAPAKPPARAKPAAPAPAPMPAAREAETGPTLVAQRTARLAESDRLSGLFDMEKRLALRIYAAAGVELTPAERADVSARRTDNLQAVLAYGRGLLASDAGDFATALRYFRQAVRLDPGFAPAQAQVLAARAIAAAEGVSTAQVAAAAERAVAQVQAAATLALPFARDAVAELIGTEGLSASTRIELVITRPGGAQ